MVAERRRDIGDIHTVIESALTNGDEELVFMFEGMSLPIYGAMPDFGGNEPECYIVYSEYSTPSLFADNTELCRGYTVTVNIITQSMPVPALEKAIEARMKSQGFIYQGGGKLDFEDDYPAKCRRYQEYKISYEEEL